MKKCRSSLSSFVFCRRKFFVSFFSLLLSSENIFKPHHTLQHTQKKIDICDGDVLLQSPGDDDDEEYIADDDSRRRRRRRKSEIC